MKIGILQLNQQSGDFPHNVRNLIDHYRACLDQGAELVIAPAQSLCGPDLKDLVLRSAYSRQHDDALHYLSKELGNTPLILGTIEQNQETLDFEHSAYMLRNENVQKLTNTNCEETASNETCINDTLIANTDHGKIAVLIGLNESLPDEGIPYGLIIRLHTETWFSGLLEEDEHNDCFFATTYSCPVASIRMAGGQENNLYSGGSCIINPKGDVINRLPLFKEAYQVIDTNTLPGKCPLSPLDEQIYQALVTGIRDFINKSGFSSVCLGLSGGIDSALVATLAVDALGAQNVYGLAMPGPYSSQHSIDDAYALADNLGIACQTIPIEPTLVTLKEAMTPLFKGTEECAAEENMQARIRGIMLMSYSNKFGHLLLATSNKSELAVGYSTMYGDSCGALLPIGDLYKTEVYRLSNYINKISTTGERIPNHTIVKPPSAELRPDQTDQDSLPPYEILDEVLKELIDHNTSATDLIDQGRFEEHIVRKIQRLIKISEWKRKQAAPILALSPYTFGSGRDIPFIHKLND